MRFKELKLSTVLLISLGLSGVQAQESVLATGGNASGSGGSVSYSVGQVVYATNTGTSGSVTQGVQQPYEISVVSGIEQVKGITLICMAYPNPTTDLLTLEITNYDSKGLRYLLYNMNGKLLESKKLRGNKTTITLAKLAPATYFLKVLDNQKEVKTFRIIKN